MLRALIMAKDHEGIRAALKNNPALANEGISCFDDNPCKAHPLHRVCDGVMNGLYTDEEALEMAKILLAFGADINGGKMVEKHDTPLVAAASLHAERTGMYYIDRGADIFHAGGHGGTALHWAAWTGRNKLVKKLIDAGAEIEKRCIDFQGTPLLWAVHGYKESRRLNQVECVRLLVEAGADTSVKNIDGVPILSFLGPEDKEMISLVQ